MSVSDINVEVRMRSRIAPELQVPAHNLRAVARSPQVSAQPEAGQVLGQVHADQRLAYQVHFRLRTIMPHRRGGTRQVKVPRLGYIPPDNPWGVTPGVYWFSWPVLEPRPDCTCRHFQFRCLDGAGHWTGAVCKHVVAQALAIARQRRVRGVGPLKHRAWRRLLGRLVGTLTYAPTTPETEAILAEMRSLLL